MSNHRFFGKIDETFLTDYLQNKLGLRLIFKVKLLPDDKEKNDRLCKFYIIPEGYHHIKEAIGRFDNLNFSYYITFADRTERFSHSNSWQKCLHRCCGERYYNWHEDNIDRQIIELKQKSDNIKVGKYNKNLKEAHKIKNNIQHEIKTLEDSRLTVAGKVRKTPVMQ